MSKNEYFCDKSIKPWIMTLIFLSVFLVIWILFTKEELRVMGEGEVPQQQVLPSGVGEPTFPAPVNPVAFSKPFSAKHYGVAAITKATPHGGVQLVANPRQNDFQHRLKDAVNDVIPTVCDIHAMWINRSFPMLQRSRNNGVQFKTPFDGNIDKFISNKGYENIGAGVLIDEKGYILTNHHVVEDATDIIVTVPGNPSRDYAASIIAHDVTKDLALLKIKARKIFPEARLGDSSFTQIGDYVIAVGSPFGMEQTVTSGIISGIRKSIKIAGVRYKNLFQTDAPINKGSSGGPLVNLAGEVIGITTAIYAPTGVFNGTGFVIPINDAKAFLSRYTNKRYSLALDNRGMLKDELINRNGVGRQAPLPIRFGVEAISVDPVMARQLGLKDTGGILVNKVFENSPASFAGIKRGDVITSIAGVPILKAEDVSAIVFHLKVGDNVHVRILRNRRLDEILVKLR